MTSGPATNTDPQDSLEWRLYAGMLVTRLFEEALLRWEHDGKISAQTFPSKGQEAIAIGCCLALQQGDAVIPSFRTRGAMIGMGVGIAEQLREFVHSPLAVANPATAAHSTRPRLARSSASSGSRSGSDRPGPERRPSS